MSDKRESDKADWPSGFRGVLFFALMLVCFFAYEMGNRPFANPDEGRYVEIPREMLATGDFITPKLDGLKYFEKPPLLYWMQSAIAKVCGINEYSMRAIIVVFAILGCLSVFLTGRKRFSSSVGLVAGSILATNLLYYVHSHLIILDLVTAVLMCGTLWCFYALFVQKEFVANRKLLLLMYALAALTCLTKGLIGIVLPGLVVFLWMLFTNNWKVIPQILSLPGVVIFLLVAAPWHVIMAMRHDDFLYKYFIVEHFQRYTTTIHSRYQPAYFFIPIVILGLFPWTGFSLVAMKNEIAKAMKRNSESIFFLCWILGIFVFYSFSNSKLIPYILPIVPPIAFVSASTVLSGDRDFKYGACIQALISFAMVFAFFECGCTSLKDLLLDKEFMLAIHIIISLVILGGLVLLCGAFFESKRFYAIFMAIFVGMNILWVVNKGAVVYQEIRKPSTKKMAELIRLNRNKDDAVFCHGYYYQDFPVYLQDTVGVVNYIGELEFGLNADPSKKNMFPGDKEFWEMWTTTKQRVFLLLSLEAYRGVFKKNIAHRILGLDKHFVVIMNR